MYCYLDSVQFSSKRISIYTIAPDGDDDGDDNNTNINKLNAINVLYAKYRAVEPLWG